MTDTAHHRADVLKVAEVAERLRTTDKLVYRLIERGDLRAVKLGRHKRVTERALEDFLNGTR